MKSRRPIPRYRPASKPRRVNPDGGTIVTGSLDLRNPQVRELAKGYEDWHWGAKPKKLIHVRDRLVPNLVGIGQLREFHIRRLDGKGTEVLKLPKGSWIGFDPKHPHERLHVVLPAAYREKMRKGMKYVNPTQPIQEISQATGGTHVPHKLPNVHGVPLGVLNAVIYHTDKEGDGPSDYQHEFGKEHSGGIKPILAIDVSGRMWICGGSYTCPLPGITG